MANAQILCCVLFMVSSSSIAAMRLRVDAKEDGSGFADLTAVMKRTSEFDSETNKQVVLGDKQYRCCCKEVRSGRNMVVLCELTDANGPKEIWWKRGCGGLKGRRWHSWNNMGEKYSARVGYDKCFVRANVLSGIVASLPYWSLPELPRSDSICELYHMSKTPDCLSKGKVYQMCEDEYATENTDLQERVQQCSATKKLHDDAVSALTSQKTRHADLFYEINVSIPEETRTQQAMLDTLNENLAGKELLETELETQVNDLCKDCGPSFTVEVVDSRGIQPVEGAVVSLLDKDHVAVRSKETNSLGVVELLQDVRCVTVLASKDGFVDESRDFAPTTRCRQAESMGVECRTRLAMTKSFSLAEVVDSRIKEGEQGDQQGCKECDDKKKLLEEMQQEIHKIKFDIRQVSARLYQLNHQLLGAKSNLEDVESEMTSLEEKVKAREGEWLPQRAACEQATQDLETGSTEYKNACIPKYQDRACSTQCP